MRGRAISRLNDAVFYRYWCLEQITHLTAHFPTKVNLIKEVSSMCIEKGKPLGQTTTVWALLGEFFSILSVAFSLINKIINVVYEVW